MPRTFNFLLPPQRAQAEQTVFGSGIADDVYADLAGDIAGDGQVEVRFNQLYVIGNKVYPITIRTQSVLFSSTIRLDAGEFNFSELAVRRPGNSIGRLVVNLMAKTARQWFATLNGQGIRVVNAANPANNAWGYYAFATYGFNAPIPAAVLPNLPAANAGAVNVIDLMQTPAGKAFWRQHGQALPHMEFDLAANSPSWDVLRLLW